MDKFNPEHKAVLDEILLDDPRVKTGKMFGFPAYYAGRKLAICLYENGVGVKLQADKAVSLIKEDENVIPFQPLRRQKMKEWVQINLTDSEAYRNYQEILYESLDFVFSLKD
jgi:hypothetical protein